VPETLAAEVPPKTELGDLAFPAAFELAKLVKQQTGEKQNPRAIAEKLKTAIESLPEVARAEVAGPGYLNVFFDRAAFLIELTTGGNATVIEPVSGGENPNVSEGVSDGGNATVMERVSGGGNPNISEGVSGGGNATVIEHVSGGGNPNVSEGVSGGGNATVIEPVSGGGNPNVSEGVSSNSDQTAPKLCVEHTSVNPNKAAHIGHVRNAVIGDTFARILRAGGNRVEVQYYIDNTGVQVADVVIGFMHLEKMTLGDIKRLDEELSMQNKSFDYYCWDLYARVGQYYKENEEALKLRAEVLQSIEEGEDDTAKMGDYIATRNSECIVRSMERLGIRYDLLPRESEILHLHFWAKAFEKMKQLGVIKFQMDGKNAGCWVMPFGDHTGTDEHEANKILVRSNGTVTYTGKDIAYQLWKLGMLGMDFNYKIFQYYYDRKEVWVTTTEETVARNVPDFGHGEMVYNVIDSRQSYPQEIVRKGVAAISPEKGETASVHLSYEMVALSPAAAAELGFQISDEDKAKSFIEMSGRKGLGVKADDLLDRLIESALGEVEKRHADLDAAAKKDTARMIAVGALRYFLLKFTRSTVIVFDFKEALSFEGETGPYCQYAAVRANSIFRKLDEGGLKRAHEIIAKDQTNIAEIFGTEEGGEIWTIIMLAARLEETIANAAAAAEPAVVAKYAFNLAKAFNFFYHNHKILSEENAARRSVLLAAADIARRRLTAALNILGIDVPERM
jgi:arginyl-tRNA synthetase